MKRYITYTAGLSIVLSLFSSCKKFVETDPRGQFTQEGYYRNQAEVFNGLVAAYDPLGFQGGDYVSKITAMNAGSDDNLAGGGGSSDFTPLQAISNYTLIPANGPQDALWKGGFLGVYRVNILLSKIDGATMPEDIRSRYKAELKALRAYYYFDLVRLFKNIPLMLTPVAPEQAYSVLQVAPEEVYTQIEKDLKEAIAEDKLPNTVPKATEAGRMTKGTAHALLGKVYLYEKKFTESAAEFALVNGVPGQLNSVYGYKLLDDFAALWKTVNKFNTESILEISHTSKGNGAWSCIECTEGNLLSIMLTPRAYTALLPGAPDYVSGYGALIVTKNFFDFIHFDPRNKTSVANLDSLKKAGVAKYDNSYENTGFFVEKFAGRASDKSTGGGPSELNYPQNTYEIRLADTYLMEAEAIVRGGGDLSRARALIAAVRNRAFKDGKDHAVDATLDNIITERRAELAFEGQRWFDLIRWGKAATVLASKGFIAGKHEILPIPLKELENTKLVQSKEWGGTK